MEEPPYFHLLQEQNFLLRPIDIAFRFCFLLYVVLCCVEKYSGEAFFVLLRESQIIPMLINLPFRRYSLF